MFRLQIAQTRWTLLFDFQPLQAFQYPVVRTGDELHSFYGGLNFHIFGDYLLLQTGLEYRILKNNESLTEPDYDSWLWQAGGRAAF